MPKILIHTLGSSGDFNPLIALAYELQDRGHSVKFAVNPANAIKISNLGFESFAIGPDPDWNSDFSRRLLVASSYRPFQMLMEELFIPNIGVAYDNLLPHCREADIFISHTLQLASPAIAYRTGVPWVSVIPATSCYPTAEYPLPCFAWRGSPEFLNKVGWDIGLRQFRTIDALANEQYRALGVPPRKDMIAGGSYSRQLTIGLWSPAYFPRPTDWPAWFQVGGYARWDAPGVEKDLNARVPQGSGPLVIFTLGSAIVNQPGDFYEVALEAVRATNWRAILLGAPAEMELPQDVRNRVTAIPYARYADIFPLASAIVHQGGVGTTQACCYYGIPSVVVPRCFDQFENAAHIQRSGWGLRLLPKYLSPALLRVRLERVLRSREIKRAVHALGAEMQTEPDIKPACDMIEAILYREPTASDRLAAISYAA